MAKRIIYECDRCEATTENQQRILSATIWFRIERGGRERRDVDMCTMCADEQAAWFQRGKADD